MMDNQFELPVSISIKPSFWLQGWIILIHLGSIPAIMISGLPWALKLAGITVVIASLYLTQRKFIMAVNPSSIVHLLLNNREEWWLTAANGRKFMAELMPVPLVHPMLTVLCFKYHSRIYPVILMPDGTDSNELRRLRVRLRFRK